MQVPEERTSKCHNWFPRLTLRPVMWKGVLGSTWGSKIKTVTLCHQQLEGLFKAQFSSVGIASDLQHLCILLHGFVAHSRFQFLMVKAMVAQAKWHN